VKNLNECKDSAHLQTMDGGKVLVHDGENSRASFFIMHKRHFLGWRSLLLLASEEIAMTCRSSGAYKRKDESQ
jgi:hypothetical protein